jgi:hypothetical protein
MRTDPTSLYDASAAPPAALRSDSVRVVIQVVVITYQS